MDKALELIEFDINFHIDKVCVEMTGNKSDKDGNSKLTSFGFENQGFKISKEDKEITMNMFGITFGSYNKLEEVYKFVNRTKNTVTDAGKGMAKQLDEESYIKALQDAVKDAKSKHKFGASDLSKSDFGGAGDDF